VDVMRARELAREEEYKGFWAKCEAAMTDLDKKPVVLLIQEKMSSLAAKAKKHKRNLDRLMLKSQKWSGYQPATEPVNKHVRTTADLGGSPKGDTFVVHTRSVAAYIRDGKCKTKGGSSIKDDTPLLSILDDDEGLKNCLELKYANAYHLKISAISPPTWKGFLDKHIDVDLLDLYDHCYARQVIMDNTVNRRSHELLEIIEKLKGKVDVMRARELAREEEYKGFWAKCEAAMTDIDKKPVVLLIQEKMSSLAAEAKKYKRNLDRLMLESQKWSGYQVSLLLWSQRLVGKLVSLAITFDRCRAYEQVARMNEPFDLSKVKGYFPSYEKEHTQASNDLATATFSWLNEYVADACASVEALLSKKPLTLYKHVPSRTQMHVTSS
nr:hypothetical protein [Tanacetum cinerariifolium]